jgi:hypothetical protein
MLNRIIKFFLENKLVTVILLVLVVGWGIVVAPFNWNTLVFFPMILYRWMLFLT